MEEADLKVESNYEKAVLLTKILYTDLEILLYYYDSH